MMSSDEWEAYFKQDNLAGFNIKDQILLKLPLYDTFCCFDVNLVLKLIKYCTSISTIYALLYIVRAIETLYLAMTLI